MRSCYVPTEKFSLLSVNCSWACLIFSTYLPFKLNAIYPTAPITTVEALAQSVSSKGNLQVADKFRKHARCVYAQGGNLGAQIACIPFFV